MRALLFPLAFFLLLALALLAYVALLSRHRKASVKPLNPVGRVALVERDLNPEGFVLVEGELWPARTRDGSSVASVGARVRVVGASGHMLEVEMLD
jgi:membrane protein implicated in regulation of membrane protease activity